MFRGFFGGDEEEVRARERYFGMRGSPEPPTLVQRARTVAGMEPTQTEQLVGGVCPSLTFKQRLYGFAICFGVGITISVTSMLSFNQLLGGNPVPFAIKYTTGNVLSLLSTCFLVGPKRQLRNMTAATRWVAALIYLVAMAMTLVSCFVIKSGLIVLICIVVQFCAMAWYALSYIPYGRRIFKSCLRSAVAEV